MKDGNASVPGALAGMLRVPCLSFSLSLVGVGWWLDPEIINAEDARYC